MEMTELVVQKRPEEHPQQLQSQHHVATPCYPNSTIPRGYCIIIDNYSEAEDGSEDCIQNLKRLGFHVERFNQLNVNSIRMLLQFVSKLDHSNYSSLMVIARGRGEGGVMYGNDNKKIALGEFVTYFSTEDCSSLQHKPKLFLFQTYGAPRQSSNENMSHVLADSFQVVYKSPTSTEGIYTFIRKVVDDNGETSVNDIIIQNASQMAYHYKPETLLYYHQQNTNSTMTVHELEMSSRLWKVIQESTLQTLKKNRNNIQNVSFDIRKGKVAGSSTSIVGGIITIIGFLLLLNDDFILSSIFLTVIGSLIAIYGGLISIVATIVKCMLQKRERNEAKEIATIYVQLCRIILDLVEELEVAHKDEDQTQDRYQTFARAIRTTLQSGMILTYGGLFITRTGGTAALRGWILTFRIVSIGVRIVAIAGAITAVIMIVIDVWELLFNAYKLRIKKEPELVKRMNTFIDEIEKQKEQYHQNIENERTVIQLQTPAPVEDAAV